MIPWKKVQPPRLRDFGATVGPQGSVYRLGEAARPSAEVPGPPVG
ncbi:hypothetical protein ACIBSV_36035 [Embleya sp. NPDC050154]